jgi:tripartite-type tricarboxylate transporter receptor subunit TctC
MAVLGLVAVGLLPSPAQAWEPEQPVELVIMAGKGGGADKMARLFARLIKEEDLSPQPFEPVNMPGNSGAEALLYLLRNAGSRHVVLVTLNSFYTTPLRQPELAIDIERFTPIGRMAEDTFLLWVHGTSPIATLDDFVRAASAKGAGWIMAGTGTASEDDLLTDTLNATFGLSMTYRPFDGGGEVADDLAEGRADSTVNNPAEQEDHYVAGRTKPIAAFTAERLSGYPDLPTFRETGHDLVYLMQRSVVGPPDMPAEAAAFYQELFRQIYESKEWQDYMNTANLLGAFITGDELRAYWAEERATHRALLANLGRIN